MNHPDSASDRGDPTPGRTVGRRLRSMVGGVLPGAWRRRLRDYFGWRWFRGEYRTWADARAAARGYDDGAIVKQVLAATLEVKAGRAAFERDGVLFQTVEPDRLLLALLQEIARPAGRLRVLDFGGSLGSNYWRHRTFLPTGDHLHWDVVEQAAFVDAGCRHLTDTTLKFHRDVQAAQAVGGHDVLLCSGVLQYLEEPFRAVEEWSQLEIPYLLFNNLPLHAKGPDRLRVQHVPPSIYPASYPVWFFNRTAFLQRVGVHYEVVKEFASEAQWQLAWGMLPSTGLLLRRRASA